MTAREDLEQAAAATRSKVAQARDALARTRAAAGGGPAGSPRRAEEQIESIRTAIEHDVRTLRARAGSVDVTSAGPARTAAIAAGAGLLAVVGVAVAGATGLRRARGRREIDRQARALAAALARQASSAVLDAPRRGRGGSLLAVTGIALAAGVGVIVKRRGRPIDEDDLWLPERPARTG
jgi:hypothetical protein